MKEKNEAKTNISTILLVVAIIVIIAMGYFVYKLYNEKTIETDKVSKLNSKISELENVQKNTDDSSDKIIDANENAEKSSSYTNEYRSNFSKSVVKELGEDNMIYVDLSGYDDNNGKGYVSINNKHEAYIYLSSVKEYSSANNLKKISDNVVNAWYCEEGQDSGNEYILFLKTDGTVSYMKFSTDYSSNSKTKFEDTEKTINGLTDISDVIPISGGDENGIGGLGVLIVKSDGTCSPYSTLDDLVKK